MVFDAGHSLPVRKRSTSKADVRCWHKAEVQGCYILGPVTAA